MNAQLFLGNFGHLAGAPDGVKRLRDLVSYFAITGKLTSRRDGDSVVTTLAEDALDSKERYLGKTSVRRFALKNVELRQTVALIPEWWTLLAAGDLMDFINGRAFKPSDWKTSGLPIIRIQNLNNPSAPYNYFQGEVSDGHRVQNGDLLLSWSGTPGTSFGAFIWQGNEAVLNQHIFKVVIYSQLVDKEYLRIAINACLDALIGSARGGVGLKHVTKGQVEALLIPCPPLEEQRRICSKVEELMTLCDNLEAKQKERERSFPVLSRAIYSRFVEAPTHENLKSVFDQVGSVSPEDSRKAIISLAIQGKIVVEDLDDRNQELAKVDLRRITIASRKSAKWSGPIEDKEKPFSLPPAWEWVRLGDIATLKHGFAFSSASFTSKPTPFVLMTPGSFFEKGGFRDRGSKTKYYNGSVDSNFILKPGDLIIPMTEQAAGLLGSPAFIPDDGKTYLHNQRLGKIEFPSKAVAPEFAFWFFNSEFFRGELARTCTGMKVRHTSPDRVLRVLFPVCPYSEQLHIVAKIDKLLSLVRLLELQQAQKSKVAATYAQATVAAITGMQTKKSEPVKAPQTELLTKLEIGTKPNATDEAPLASLISKSAEGLSAKVLWQQSGMKIDAFYQQLKTEMTNKWILEPEKAIVQEVESEIELSRARPMITTEVRNQVFSESGDRCAACGTVTPLQLAHIIPWNKSGKSNAENLVCLCANCHGRADKEDWSTETLHDYKLSPWILRNPSH
ncbi:MAG: restriction endonuclease subunit S [Verrucomicrobiota bacterium]